MGSIPTRTTMTMPVARGISGSSIRSWHAQARLLIRVPIHLLAGGRSLPSEGRPRRFESCPGGQFTPPKFWDRNAPLVLERR